MTDCFIYDAVRTPRGKGRKKDGALADATPLRLAKTVLQALPERGGFDNAQIEDVILGCVEPVGEQGVVVDEGEPALERALAWLPAEQREVLALKVEGGLTFAEIGAALAISPHTAASRYRYALERLAGSLEDIRKARHEAR